jgi:arylsulfatase A-like enzyme
MAAGVRLRSNALFVVFVLGVGALPLLAAGAAESITLKPVADTTVVEGKSSPLGTSKTLKADNSPRSETYVRFTLGSIDTATITRARLRLWVTNGSSNGPSLHAVTAAWDEASTNFAGRPTVGAVVADLRKVKSDAWQTFDVTALAQLGTTDFALVGTSSDGTDFVSREGSSRRRPQLIVDMGASTTSSTATTGTTDTTTGPPPSGDRPNVMIILTDDQRSDQTFDVMPKTRSWLIEGGTRFPNGYVTTPLCCPARSTLMSGRYMHNHTVYDNGQDEKLDKDWTLARYLQDAGYRTAMAGKYLVGYPRTSAPPNYDRYAVTTGGYNDVPFNVDGTTRTVPYSTDFIGQITNTFLDDFEADDARPWFMYVTPQAPHSDFEPADRHVNAPVPAFVPSPAFDDDKSDTAPFLENLNRTMGETVFEHDNQLRTLLSVDEMVDSIMKRLEANGELADTLIIYSSDNGYHWGEFGVRGKGLPFSESVRVPYVVRWPGHVDAGATDGRLVANVDFLPSILDAAGISPPTVGYPFDGRSIFSSYSRQESLTEFHTGYHDYPSWASIRTHDWFYAEYYGSDDRAITFREYYDLAADPYQLTNLLKDSSAANDPDVPTLSARLARYRNCVGTTGTNACP